VAVVKISARAGGKIHEITIERENGLYVIEIDGERRKVDALRLESDFYSILMGDRSYEVSVEADGDRYFVRHGAAEQIVTLTDPGRRAREDLGATEGPQDVVTVMPGKIVRVLVGEGDDVEEGQGVVVVEAMKMENEIGSPKNGKISAVKVESGQTVEAGATLVVVE
jgi:biotin carboxyl carrier protein